MAISTSSSEQSRFCANPIYWEKFRKHVFCLIKVGYDRLDPARYANSEETDITGELVKKMREVTEDNSYPWASHFAVHEDPPVNIPERYGKRRPKLDILIERTQRGPRPHYAFEAKRLSTGHSGVSHYLGKEGVGRYIRGIYAREDNEAGMLGYVQSDSEEHWCTRISTRLMSNINDMHVYPGGELVDAPIIHALNHCYRSKHIRTSYGKTITIYHLLLLFC